MKSYDQLYIDGQWVRPKKGGTFGTIDPCTESVITQVAATTAEDVDLAVKAARSCWSMRSIRYGGSFTVRTYGLRSDPSMGRETVADGPASGSAALAGC